MDPIVAALRDALLSVRSDGRVPHSVVERLRAAAREGNGPTAPPVSDIVSHLPAFETLPAEARRSLYAAVLRDDSWSMWLRRAAWRQALTRGARTIEMKI